MYDSHMTKLVVFISLFLLVTVACSEDITDEPPIDEPSYVAGQATSVALTQAKTDI